MHGKTSSMAINAYYAEIKLGTMTGLKILTVTRLHNLSSVNFHMKYFITRS